ncbi:MAG: penicillin-binding transpeptidase domain-containing protein, partial [Bdellovibrionia bacterium]
PIRTKTWLGKLNQIGLATWLELWHSKDEILEAYFNLVPMGGNIEGIGAASLIYFQKAPPELTSLETAIIGVLPNDPRKVPPDLAKSIARLPFHAPHFTDLVLRDARLSARLETTLDLPVQRLLESRIKHYVKTKRDLGVSNAVAVVVDHRAMEVVALAGSADYFDSKIQGQFNGALGLRSPGSALKPFVYALAIQQGLIHPKTLLKDVPTSFSGFDPENFDRDFRGPVSATTALTSSRNVPAVWLTNQLNAPTFYDFLKDTGLRRMRGENFYGHALSLGGVELSMLELIRLYGALANFGEIQQLGLVKDAPREAPRRVLSAESAFVVLDMLTKHTLGNGDQYARSKPWVAWKTGTSHGFRDAWSIGITNHHIIAVWLGHFDNTFNPAFIGRTLAAPLMFGIVEALDSGSEPPLPRAHLNVSKIEVCALSGHLPNEHCPHKRTTWFLPGVSPIAQCSIHRKLSLDPESGLRVCGRDDAVKKVFEVWPSDLLKLFRQAGLARRAPPPFDASCSLTDLQSQGLPPQIQSPRTGVVYHYAEPENLNTGQGLPLSAVADGDSHKLNWFVDRDFVGQGAPDQPVYWKPKLGRHTVRVVDDLGRSDSRPIHIQILQ